MIVIASQPYTSFQQEDTEAVRALVFLFFQRQSTRFGEDKIENGLRDDQQNSEGQALRSGTREDQFSRIRGDFQGRSQFLHRFLR